MSLLKEVGGILWKAFYYMKSLETSWYKSFYIKYTDNGEILAEVKVYLTHFRSGPSDQ